MLKSGVLLYKNAYQGLNREVWWLSVVMFINRCGTMVMPFMSIYLKKELAFSVLDAGLILGFFGVGAIQGAYLGGKLVDRIGFYHVQVGSLVLNGLMFFVLGQMRGFWSIGITIYILASLGEAFRPANATAIAFYSKPENRTRSYSLNRLAINLGFGFGPAIGGLLATFSYNWLFIVDGTTCILAALLLVILFRPQKKKNKDAVSGEKPVMERQSAYKDHTYLKFSLLTFLVAFCFMQMFSTVPLFYEQIVGLSESVIGMVFASNGLIIALTEMILIYKIENKRSGFVYISSGALLIGISYLVLTIQPLLGIVLLGMTLITLGEMLMFPFVNSYWISRSNETNRGQYAALHTMAFGLANVLAPAIGTLVVGYFGYLTLWYLLFLICGLSALFFRKFR